MTACTHPDDEWCDECFPAGDPSQPTTRKPFPGGVDNTVGGYVLFRPDPVGDDTPEFCDCEDADSPFRHRVGDDTPAPNPEDDRFNGRYDDQDRETPAPTAGEIMLGIVKEYAAVGDDTPAPTACAHANRAWTIGGPGDTDGYVWCPECRTNLTALADDDPHYPDHQWVWVDGNNVDAVVIYREWQRYQRASAERWEHESNQPVGDDTPAPKIEGGVTACGEPDSNRPTDPAERGRHTPPSPGPAGDDTLGADT